MSEAAHHSDSCPNRTGLWSKFVDNTVDLTKKHGLKIASFASALGSVILAQEIFKDTDPLVLRQVMAPVAFFGGCVAGLFNKERTQNTFGLVGCAMMAASFAGGDGEETSIADYGLCAMNIAGVVTYAMGSHLWPAKKKEREDKGDIDSVAQDGKTWAAAMPTIGNVINLGLAFFSNKADVVIPYGIWLGGSALKTARAVLCAQDKIDARKKQGDNAAAIAQPA